MHYSFQTLQDLLVEEGKKCSDLPVIAHRQLLQLVKEAGLKLDGHELKQVNNYSD